MKGFFHETPFLLRNLATKSWAPKQSFLLSVFSLNSRSATELWFWNRRFQKQFVVHFIFLFRKSMVGPKNQEDSGGPRISQDLAGSSRILQNLPGSPKISQNLSWFSQVLPGSLRISQDLPGSPRISQDLPGSPRTPPCNPGAVECMLCWQGWGKILSGRVVQNSLWLEPSLAQNGLKVIMKSHLFSIKK